MCIPVTPQKRDARGKACSAPKATAARSLAEDCANFNCVTSSAMSFVKNPRVVCKNLLWSAQHMDLLPHVEIETATSSTSVFSMLFPGICSSLGFGGSDPCISLVYWQAADMETLSRENSARTGGPERYEQSQGMGIPDFQFDHVQKQPLAL